MNIEYRQSNQDDLGALYSVEFPQSSATCQIKFWFISRGGKSPLTSTLLINGEREGSLFQFKTTANYSNWQPAGIDLGKE